MLQRLKTAEGQLYDFIHGSERNPFVEFHCWCYNEVEFMQYYRISQFYHGWIV
jgi:hypothetical protein